MMVMVAVAAGKANATIINGILVDATDTTELMQANVALLQMDKDSTYVKGTITDFNGVFNLEDVPEGRYYLKCSYIGYEPTVKRVSVGADGYSSTAAWAAAKRAIGTRNGEQEA